MKTEISARVVVMDVNHHVRDFLKRELEKDGLPVTTAGSSQELSHCLSRQPSPQVVVIDPEMFQPGDASRIERIMRRHPGIQLIFHTYVDCFDEYAPASAHFVEKSASSIASLKEKIREVAGLVREG